MPRYNVRIENPNRYAQVKAEQDKLRAECARNSNMTLARLCPYCDHKIEQGIGQLTVAEFEAKQLSPDYQLSRPWSAAKRRHSPVLNR